MRCLPGSFNPQAHNRGSHSGSEMTSCPGKTIGWNPHRKWEEAIRSKQDQTSNKSWPGSSFSLAGTVFLAAWPDLLAGRLIGMSYRHKTWDTTVMTHERLIFGVFVFGTFESIKQNSKRSTFGNLSKGQRSSQDQCVDQYSYTAALDQGFMMGHSVIFCPPKKAIRSCSIWHLKADL